MNPTDSLFRSRMQRWTVYSIFALLAVAAVLWRDPFDLPLIRDNQFQFFMAERVASGEPPYESFITPKHTATYLITGAAIRAGRILALPDLATARAVTALLFLLAVVFAVEIGWQLSKSWLAAALGGLALLSFPGLTVQAAMGCRPKLFIVFAILLTLLMLARNRPGWAGCAGMLCYLIWQPGVVVLAAAAVAVVTSRESATVRQDETPRRTGFRLRELTRFLTAAFTLLIAYEAYFLYHGVLVEQLRQSYELPLRFMQRVWHPPSFILPNLWKWLGQAVGAFHPATLCAIMAVAFGALGTAVNPRRAASWLLASPLRSGLVGSALGAFVLTYWDHQGYPDMLFLAPFIALAPPLLLSGLTRGSEVQQRLGAVLAIVLAATTAIALRHPAPSDGAIETLTEQIELATRVGLASEEVHGVYVISCLHLLAFNHQPNWSNASFFFRGLEDYLVHRSGGMPELPAIDGQLPDLVLTSRRQVSRKVRQRLSEQYRRVGAPAFRKHKIEVWALPHAHARVRKIFRGEAAEKRRTGRSQ